jgi:ribonuclease P/MRP protein subunit RPP40
MKKDIEKIEKLQHRATRIHCLKGLSYEKRCEKLCLPTLEDRRLRGDMIQMYKVLNGLDAIKWHNPQEFVEESITRGHNKRIRKQIVKRANVRYQFFTNRITNNWNKLPQETIDSKNINLFKNSFDKFTSKGC